MRKTYAYESDEGICMLHIAPQCSMSVDEILAKDVPSGVTVHEIDVADLPTSRRFRGAWTLDSGAVGIDMPKARDVLRNEFRSERVAMLATLDVEFMQAQENGDATETARVVAAKQALRDLPAHASIEAAATIDVLDALKLDDLI